MPSSSRDGEEPLALTAEALSGRSLGDVMEELGRAAGAAWPSHNSLCERAGYSSRWLYEPPCAYDFLGPMFIVHDDFEKDAKYAAHRGYAQNAQRFTEAVRPLIDRVKSGVRRLEGIREPASEHGYDWVPIPLGFFVAQSWYIAFDDEVGPGAADLYIEPKGGTKGRCAYSRPRFAVARCAVMGSAVGASASADSEETYRSGGAGRPSAMHHVEQEMRRRHKDGALEKTLAAECRALETWLQTEHPDAPRLTSKAIENSLRSIYWGLSNSPSPKADSQAPEIISGG